MIISKKCITIIFFSGVLCFFIACNNKSQSSDVSEHKINSSEINTTISSSVHARNSDKTQKTEIRVTFIELGSVKCIPCKMMQPIMKEVEEEYGNQVKVIFYDVWTQEGKPYATKYRIRVIPTQVFLDKDGKEYFRHEGFFPKEDLVKILKQKGVN